MADETMTFAYLIHLGQNLWHEPDGDPGPLGFWSDTLICEDKAWKEVTDYLPGCGVNTLVIDLADGLQYDSHPEIANGGAWSKQKLRDELKRLRAMGLEPIPKLNFSTLHDAWLHEYAHMVSSPIYYKVVKDLIDEVCELFDKPRLFHLGMDEEGYGYIHMQGKHGMTCARQGELFWHDVNYFISCIEQNGARPWMWGDRAWFYPDDLFYHLSREVVLSDGTYGHVADIKDCPEYTKNCIENIYRKDEKGYDQIVLCATYSGTYNQDDMMDRYGKLKHLKGFITAPWFRTREGDVLKLKAEAQVFGNAIRSHFGEVTK